KGRRVIRRSLAYLGASFFDLCESVLNSCRKASNLCERRINSCGKSMNLCERRINLCGKASNLIRKQRNPYAWGIYKSGIRWLESCECLLCKFPFRGCSKSPVTMTSRYSSLACFSAVHGSTDIHPAPWKIKELFPRAM